MRKFFSFFAAAALLMFCLTSCQKDQTKITIKARIASNGLKTELGPLNDASQHPIHWNSGDQIMVWVMVDSKRFSPPQVPVLALFLRL